MVFENRLLLTGEFTFFASVTVGLCMHPSDIESQNCSGFTRSPTLETLYDVFPSHHALGLIYRFVCVTVFMSLFPFLCVLFTGSQLISNRGGFGLLCEHSEGTTLLQLPVSSNFLVCIRIFPGLLVDSSFYSQPKVICSVVRCSGIRMTYVSKSFQASSVDF